MAKKGCPKPPGSGRKKGVPNKRSLFVKERTDKLKLDPVDFLIAVMEGNWKKLGFPAAEIKRVNGLGNTIVITSISLDNRIKAAAELLEYCYPKRKAMEIIEEDEDDENPLSELSDEELDNL